MAKPGHRIAQTLYPLGPCVACGVPATDRHHISGDTDDNQPDNIAILCRRCHMQADGRLAAFASNPRGHAGHPSPMKGRSYPTKRKSPPPRTEEHQRNHSAAMRRVWDQRRAEGRVPHRPTSDDTKQKLSAALRGKTRTPETRARMAEAKRAWWAAKRAEAYAPPI